MPAGIIPAQRPMTDRLHAVEPVLAALWRQRRARPAPPPTRDHGHEHDGAAPDRARPVLDLSRRFGERAMDCVSATIQGDRAALVRNSADLFAELFAIWGEVGLDPREVWTELHKREQLGTLLMQLNQAQNQLPRRVLKPWRVDSTKLP